MLKLAQVLKAFDDEQAYVAEAHLLEVEVLDYKRGEVEPRYVIQQLVGADGVTVEGEDEILRLVGVALEGCGLSVRG